MWTAPRTLHHPARIHSGTSLFTARPLVAMEVGEPRDNFRVADNTVGIRGVRVYTRTQS